jgi:hypothetical protein
MEIKLSKRGDFIASRRKRRVTRPPVTQMKSRETGSPTPRGTSRKNGNPYWDDP